MSTEIITPNSEVNYKDENALLMDDIIDVIQDIYLNWSNPSQIGTKYKIDFIPKFLKLYYRTSPHLLNKHDSEKESQVAKDLEDTFYFLEGIMGNNSHKIPITKLTVNEGFKRFRDYHLLLTKENMG